MVIEILVWIGSECVTIVVAAVAIVWQVKIEIDHRLSILRANILYAPEQQRVGIKGIERADGGVEIGKDADRENNNDNDVCSTENLP